MLIDKEWVANENPGISIAATTTPYTNITENDTKDVELEALITRNFCKLEHYLSI